MVSNLLQWSSLPTTGYGNLQKTVVPRMLSGQQCLFREGEKYGLRELPTFEGRTIWAQRHYRDRCLESYSWNMLYILPSESPYVHTSSIYIACITFGSLNEMYTFGVGSFCYSKGLKAETSFVTINSLRELIRQHWIAIYWTRGGWLKEVIFDRRRHPHSFL